MLKNPKGLLYALSLFLSLSTFAENANKLEDLCIKVAYRY
jgi:hypothetical protein